VQILGPYLLLYCYHFCSHISHLTLFEAVTLSLLYSYILMITNFEMLQCKKTEGEIPVYTPGAVRRQRPTPGKRFCPWGRGFYLHSTRQLYNLQKLPENFGYQTVHKWGTNLWTMDSNPITLPLNHGCYAFFTEKYYYISTFLWTLLIPVISQFIERNTFPSYTVSCIKTAWVAKWIFQYQQGNSPSFVR